MKIKFFPKNITVDAVPGKSVMEVARAQKIPIGSSCNGMCICAECRVLIKEGEEHVLPPTTQEMKLIGGAYFLDRRRLSCQLFCFGDVTVDISEQIDKKQQAGGVTKQFLKKISKEKTYSVGGVLVEEDQEMHALSASDVSHPHSSSQNDFESKYSVQKTKTKKDERRFPSKNKKKPYRKRNKRHR